MRVCMPKKDTVSSSKSEVPFVSLDSLLIENGFAKIEHRAEGGQVSMNCNFGALVLGLNSDPKVAGFFQNREPKKN